MGVEQPAAFYDDAYTRAERYDKGLHAPWRHLWDWTSKRIPRGAVVLELGCGMGQLARLTPHAREWMGLDFSGVAIAGARATRLKETHTFLVRAVTPEIVSRLIHTYRPTIVVACEFLEHVEADLDILRATAPLPFIGTVPRKDSAGHVRHFPSVVSARERYSPLGLRVMGLRPLHWGLVRR